MATAASYFSQAHWPSLALVAGFHGALLFALFCLAPRIQPANFPRTIVASLIVPASAPVIKPHLAPIHDVIQPIEKKILAKPILSVAQKSATPTPVEIPAPQPTTAPAETAKDSAPTPEPVVLPRFDAAYLNNPAPEYPMVSRQLNEQGEVLLRVYVTEQGKAAQVEIKHSSGFPRLDNSAQRTVRRWHFVAAKQGEQAIASWVVVPILFDLRK